MNSIIKCLLGIMLMASTQLALAACLADWGMSVTRPRSFGLVLECIGFFVLFIVNVAALGANRPAGRLLVALGVLALFAVVLRERARRRWRTLDWRAARPQFANQWRAPAWRRG